MATRRRKKARSTRRKFSGLNVLDAAQAYAQISIWSDAVTGYNPIEFLTSTGTASSMKINLKEILGMGSQGGSGVYGPTATAHGIGTGVVDVMGHNFKKNFDFFFFR